MNEKILLGKDLDGEMVYLDKHSWDCDWYWGFGYLGNANCHYHLDSWLIETDITKHLSSTKITQDDWWIIGDLFLQAYAIKECAEVYRNGGNWTEEAKPYRVKRDNELIERLNKDLETVLDTVWNYIKEVI